MILSQSGWDAPPDKPAWPETEVHVWRTTVDWPETALAGLDRLLSPDEKARVERFYSEKDRRCHLVSRGWLRLLLGRYLDAPPEQLAFDYTSYGKPSLSSPQTPLRFNVSHSGRLVMIAVTAGRALGADVEMIRRDMAVRDIAVRYFSENERTTLAALPEDQQHDAFFNGWTRKEAYIKGHGHGLSLPLDQFDVTLRPGEPARLIATRHDPAEAARWDLRAFEIADGYKAAVVAEGTGWTLRCWDWPADRGRA
jgi:4'-phosphopantetheinyl transferase